MGGKIRFNVAKFGAKVASQVSKFGFGSGNNLPGYVFYKIAGKEALKDLAHEMSIGPILITGTNGKTTTTTLLIKLLSADTKIRKSFESNTIHAITTGILKGDGDLGVFEYGIRNKSYGIPDTVQRLIDPVGVVYTTISREHSQVAGVKNPFEEYVDAKSLLSQGMTRGVVISNADDPVTANIACNKRNDLHVNFYGLAIDSINDIFESDSPNCPRCGKKLEYSQKFLNHRGIYSCCCGFKRHEPNVKLIGDGDAAKINALFMNQYIDGPLEFIYTTPDENEEEIFEDHLEVIKNLNPDHMIVVPGRKSIEKAKEYYNIISEEYDNADFYPLSYDKMDERIRKLVDLAETSDYNYVIMTGCGEEQEMWENIKQKLINK